jgi:hypothetical protein
MSVPQSTSKKDPAARARLQAARAAAAAQAEAEAARKAAHEAAQAVPLPPSSAGSHQPTPGPPRSPVPSSYSGSISSHYSSQTVVPIQHPQPLHHHPQPPSQQHLYANASHGPSRTSLDVPAGHGGNYGQPAPPNGNASPAQAPARHAAGGRPLSSSGPPRSALMQVPGMTHSVSQGALPVSAAYNLDRGLPSFSPTSPRPVSIGREPSAALPLAPRPTQDGYAQDPYRQPAAPTSAPPAAQHGPPSLYAGEPDSRRNTWASLGPSEPSASPALSAYAPSTYGGPSNAVAGPSSQAGSDAPVASAKRSAESLIGYVRQIRHVLFRKSATDQFLIVGSGDRRVAGSCMG